MKLSRHFCYYLFSRNDHGIRKYTHATGLDKGQDYTAKLLLEVWTTMASKKDTCRGTKIVERSKSGVKLNCAKTALDEDNLYDKVDGICRHLPLTICLSPYRKRKYIVYLCVLTALYPYTS